jgi:hypothetical protein
MPGASKLVGEFVSREQQRQREKDAGVGVSAGARFTSARSAESRILHMGHLPCTVSNTALQDADGNFLAYAGYSQAGGPDIGA